jgi:hypothetical protein
MSNILSVPTPKDIQLYFGDRDAKVIETATQATGSIANKTIGSTNTISGAAITATSSALTTPVITTPTINSVVHNVATGSMTAAQVIGATTAFDLIAAPAAGKINIVDSIEFFLDYAAAFTSGDDVTIQYKTTAAAIATFDKGSLLGTADLAFYVAPTGYDTSASVAGFDMTANAAKAIQFKVAISAFADGAGTVLKWRIAYRTITLLT